MTELERVEHDFLLKLKEMNISIADGVTVQEVLANLFVLAQSKAKSEGENHVKNSH